MHLFHQLQIYRKRGLVRVLKEHYWTAHRGMTYLQAWFHRRNMRNTCFIGITGSAGKTTTKELSHLILSHFSESHASPQTENEHLFIARTILETKRHHRYCIAEVAGHQPGYMDLSLRMLKPDIGVLTIIGNDHFQAFKGAGIEGIAAEKSKLITNLSRDGIAILNIDDPRVKAIGERCQARIIWVGKAEGATIQLLSATSCWPEPLKLMIAFEGEKYEVLTQLHGTHLALSIMAALGVAIAAGIPLEKTIPVLEKAVPTEGRMQIVRDNKEVVFIRDDMKAPLWSLEAPLEFLKQASATRKIAVIGTITNFSGSSSDVYKQLAGEIQKYTDIAIFVDQNAYHSLRSRININDQSLQVFSNIHDASTYLKNELQKGDLVLLKGSRRASHFARIFLDRIKPIQCWRDNCGLNIFCENCAFLYQTNQKSNSLEKSY
ncbi:hypothetical protein ABO04_07725 [Nitrosomonas sp. HPC101]|nr:hypothetical protein [Nitrosomonas sp. HPC101]